MAAQEPYDADREVLETGSNRPPRDGRWGLGAVAIALVAMVIGYAIGHHRGSTTTSQRPTRAHTTVTPAAVAGPALYQTGASCSVQNRDRLQLGVQIANQSDSVLVITRVTSHEPLGGLSQIASRPGPCGELSGAVPVDQLAPPTVPPGGTIWLTVTVKVRVGCPTGLPVQFQAHYIQDGHHRAQQLPGFLDLGQVPYSGC